MNISVNSNPNIYDNTTQNIICIDEYRMKDYLRGFQDSLVIKPDLYTSIGLFITLLAANITSDFKDLGLSSSTWQAIFILLCIASFIWLIINVIQFREYRKNKKTIDDIIMTMLQNQVTNKTTSEMNDTSDYHVFSVKK